MKFLQKFKSNKKAAEVPAPIEIPSIEQWSAMPIDEMIRKTIEIDRANLPPNKEYAEELNKRRQAYADEYENDKDKALKDFRKQQFRGQMHYYELCIKYYQQQIDSLKYYYDHPEEWEYLNRTIE